MRFMYAVIDESWMQEILEAQRQMQSLFDLIKFIEDIKEYPTALDNLRQEW